MDIACSSAGNVMLLEDSNEKLQKTVKELIKEADSKPHGAWKTVM